MLANDKEIYLLENDLSPT